MTFSPERKLYQQQLVTQYQPFGRWFYEYDLRGAISDRSGNGTSVLVGYGDSTGGYAFTPKGQDQKFIQNVNAALPPDAISTEYKPRYTEIQDSAGKYIETICIHALTDFINDTEITSTQSNVLRLFLGNQSGYWNESGGFNSTGKVLWKEYYIPELDRSSLPRDLAFQVDDYIPPHKNLFIALGHTQALTASFEVQDLQADSYNATNSFAVGEVASGHNITGTVQNPTQSTIVVAVRVGSASWSVDFPTNGDYTPTPPYTPPSTILPITSSPNGNPGSGGVNSNNNPSSPSSPNSSTTPSTTGGGIPKPENPPASAGCTPISGCQWRDVTSRTTSITGGQIINTSDYTKLCAPGEVSRGIIQLDDGTRKVLCCGDKTYPPNNLGCSSLNRYSCSGGVCSLDPNGIYSSLAACNAALVPPSYTGGQCVGVSYRLILGAVEWNTGITKYFNGTGSSISWNAPDPYPTSSYILTGPLPPGGFSWAEDTVYPTYTLFKLLWNSSPSGIQWVSLDRQPPTSTFIAHLERVDGFSDNCGNPPPTCPS
jgi:hypothetical protein